MELSQAERAKCVLRWLRKSYKITQAEIAERLGYTNPTVLSQILNGQKSFPAKLPEKIAALDSRININYLLGKSDDMRLDTMDSVDLEVEKNVEPDADPEAQADKVYRELWKEERERNAKLQNRIDKLLDLLQKMGSTCK